MRTRVWTLAIVAAGLGLVVALAGWMGGEGRVTAPQFGEQEQHEPMIAQPALPADTETEVVIHTVMTEVRLTYVREKLIRASRSEAAMLDRIDAEQHNLDIGRESEGHTVWCTLINHTDDGLLVSKGTLHNLLRYRVGYSDDQGKVWRVRDTVLGNPDGGWTPTHTIPLAPRGRRVMTMDFGHVKFFPRGAQQHGAAPPGMLMYLIDDGLSVRRIVGQDVGEAERVRTGGRGRCEVQQEWPE